MIPDQFIEQLKYASPIESVIGSYVTLKRQGRNLAGLCPFHSEKTPSFVVYAHDQDPHYHCFGCGSGGDVITFIRNIENLEYVEAVKFLAARAGLTVPEDGVDDRAARLKKRVLELNRETARYFYSRLKAESGREALAYLTGRGLSVATIKKFGLGFSPDSWDSLRNHLRAKGYAEEEMLAASVVSRGRNGGTYDTFRGRVIFPIIDLRGNVVGFGGRAMKDGGPKYLNSSDTPVFKKSRNLFALNFAKNTKSDTLILAEGYMDVIAIHQAGFDNAVATLGTALTGEQTRLIGQYAKQVAIAYDSDGAGQAATKRAVNLLDEIGVTVSVLEIKGAKDPDEYIKKFGARRFGNLLEGGKGAVRFEIDRLKAGFDLESAEGKAAFLGEFCNLMAGINSDVRRDVYVSETARELEVGADALRTAITGIRKKKYTALAKKSTHNLHVYVQDKADNNRNPGGITNLEGYVAEEKLILLLMKNPDAYDAVKGGLTGEDFRSPDNRALYEAVAEQLEAGSVPELIKLSRRLDNGRMSRLSGLLAGGEGIQFYPGQAEEYIAAIKAQRDAKTPDQIAGMSPEELRAFAEKLGEKKKKT